MDTNLLKYQSCLFFLFQIYCGWHFIWIVNGRNVVTLKPPFTDVADSVLNYGFFLKIRLDILCEMFAGLDILTDAL